MTPPPPQRASRTDGLARRGAVLSVGSNERKENDFGGGRRQLGGLNEGGEGPFNRYSQSDQLKKAIKDTIFISIELLHLTKLQGYIEGQIINMMKKRNRSQIAFRTECLRRGRPRKCRCRPCPPRRPLPRPSWPRPPPPSSPSLSSFCLGLS